MTGRRICWCACAAVGLQWMAGVCLAQSTEPSAITSTGNNEPSYTPLAPADDGTAAPQPIHVSPIPDDVREEYRINPFYKRYTVIVGIPIIGSEKVSDYAFLECAWTLDHLLHGRTMALDALHKSKVRIGIIGATEYTMDIPENQHPNMIARGAYNDRRSRGLGGLPLATCAEENLLNLRGDPYVRENITIHEFSHTVASAIRRVNPDWYDRLSDAQLAAKARGDYIGGRNGSPSYAMTNAQEYWAEGAQCWFDCSNPGNSGGASNRYMLRAKDPVLSDLLTEVYGAGPWRYTKIADRKDAADLAHLGGFDRTKLPIFSFANSPRVQAEAQNGGGQRRGAPSSEKGDGKAAEEKPATPPPAGEAPSGR